MDANDGNAKNKGQFQRGDLVGPLMLVGLGVIFLLNNLGVLEWDIWWTILRLWPVLLVAAGIDLLIGRRSALGSLIAVVLIVALFVGAFWLAWRGVELEPVAGDRVSYGMDGATRAEVTISPTFAALEVGALADSNNLLEGSVRLNGGEQLYEDFDITGGTARLALSGGSNVIGPFAWMERDQVWDVGLNPDMPLDLTVDLAAGQSDLDLTSLTIDGLSVDMAAGQTTVILPAEGNFQAGIDGVVGQITVVVPEGMAVRIRMDTVLVDRQVPGTYQRQDDVYTSPGYEGADQRVDLEVNLVIGAVVIR